MPVYTPVSPRVPEMEDIYVIGGESPLLHGSSPDCVPREASGALPVPEKPLWPLWTLSPMVFVVVVVVFLCQFYSSIMEMFKNKPLNHFLLTNAYKREIVQESEYKTEIVVGLKSNRLAYC